MNIRPTQASTFALVQNGLLNNFSRLVDAQEQISSGKRILRPSDDPVGTVRALGLRSRVSATERYSEAIQGALRELDTGSSVLQDAGGLVSEARALTLQGMNGVQSPEDRRLMAGQLREIREQLLDLANSQAGGRYLFAGTAIDAKPFEAHDVNGVSRIAYRGNGDQHQLLVGADVRVAGGIPGSAIFAAQAPSGTVFEGLTGARAGTSPDQGSGVFTLRVRHASTTLAVPGGIALVAGGAYDTLIGNHTLSLDPVAGTATLDGGPAQALPAVGSPEYSDFVLTNAQGATLHLDLSGWSGGVTSGTVSGTGSMSLDGTNWTPLDGVSTDVELIDAASGGVLHVDVTQIHRAGDELVSFSGTVNIFDTLEAIAAALDNTAGASPTQQVARIQVLFDEIDRNHDNVVAGMSTLGARSARVQALDEDYGGLKTQLSGQLSQIEDADYSQVVLDMMRAEQTLQLTQSVGTRLLQSSLLNFPALTMLDPIPLPGLSASRPTGAAPSVGPVSTQSGQDSAAIGRGARFQALLEELDLRARSLAQSAREPLSAESLPGAVEDARTSLEDALHLGQDLLEAVRQSSAQAASSKVEAP